MTIIRLLFAFMSIITSKDCIELQACTECVAGTSGLTQIKTGIALCCEKLADARLPLPNMNGIKHRY